MIDALLERKSAEQREARICAGIVAAATVNLWRGKDDPPVSAEDFAPDWRDQTEGRDPDEPTEEEKLEQFKQFFESVKKGQEKKLQAG